MRDSDVGHFEAGNHRPVIDGKAGGDSHRVGDELGHVGALVIEHASRSRCGRSRAGGRVSWSCSGRSAGWRDGGRSLRARRELEVADARLPGAAAGPGVVFVDVPESAVIYGVNGKETVVSPTGRVRISLRAATVVEGTFALGQLPQWVGA